MKDLKPQTTSEFRSDFELGQYRDQIMVDGVPGLTMLRADPGDLDAKAKRTELIESVRSGKHVELAVTATTFRQQKGKPNRRYLRLGGDLEVGAKSFNNQPFLVDHNTWEQDKRKGKILSSKLIEETQSRIAFEMSFLVVKPDAVISVLDGTIDRFSIGWFGHGPVICTLHGTPAWEQCDCSPGDTVKMGEHDRLAEWEFTSWSGKELSSVNIPAVPWTDVKDVRAALAAELQLTPRGRTKENGMPFAKLAAALGLAALTDSDEDRALAAIAGLRSRVEAAEGRASALQTSLAQSEAALQVATEAGVSARRDAQRAQVDSLISTLGYQAGKLQYARDPQNPRSVIPSPREVRLRKLAERDGIDALRDELGDMPVIVPVGERMQSSTVAPPAARAGYALSGQAEDTLYTEDNPYLLNACEQLNVPIKDAVAFANKHVSTEG